MTHIEQTLQPNFTVGTLCLSWPCLRLGRRNFAKREEASEACPQPTKGFTKLAMERLGSVRLPARRGGRTLLVIGNLPHGDSQASHWPSPQCRECNITRRGSCRRRVSLPAEAIRVPGFPNVLEPAPFGWHAPNLLHSSMSAKMYAYRGALKTVDP